MTSTQHNICDLQPPAANQSIGNTGMSILYFQNSQSGNWMTDDHADNNIIIGSDRAAAAATQETGTTPTAPQQFDSACASDHCSRPVGIPFRAQDGLLEVLPRCGKSLVDEHTVQLAPSPCPDSWPFELKSSSPALGSRVSFPQPANDRSVLWGRRGFWGPPGYDIPHTGNPPSYRPC